MPVDVNTEATDVWCKPRVCAGEAPVSVQGRHPKPFSDQANHLKEWAFVWTWRCVRIFFRLTNKKLNSRFPFQRGRPYFCFIPQWSNGPTFETGHVAEYCFGRSNWACGDRRKIRLFRLLGANATRLLDFFCWASEKTATCPEPDITTS